MSTDEPYHKVSPRIWLEPWDEDTRIVALYLLTCRHRNTEGIFHMPLAYALEDLKWNLRRFKPPFAVLVGQDFVEYDEASGVCLITKALKRSGTYNPNRIKHVLGVLRDLPVTPLLDRFLLLAESHSPSLSKGIGVSFRNETAVPFERDCDRLSQQPEPAPAHRVSTGVGTVPAANLSTKRLSEVA